MICVFPYYGGRTNQLKSIIKILDEHKDKFDVIVDVFSGSGKVLLNIPDEWKKIKVYNDIDNDLYITFKVLQDPEKMKILQEKLKYAFPHKKIFDELVMSSPEKDIDIAFKTIYIFTHSFSSIGTSFRRYYKKSTTKRYHPENFSFISKWIIENEDFRELMKRYSRPRVFFYLDPPYYSGGKAYRYPFSLNDYKDMKILMDKHPGTYMLNLSLHDKEMIEIFGEPNLVETYSRPTTNTKSEIRDKWDCGYWWKF
ncbi:MAG: DNA adenine methylase [Thermoplasmata archaeon]